MRFFLTLLLGLLATKPTSAQFIFQKSIGTGANSYERAAQMIAMRSGGYLLAGIRDNFPYLARVTEQGDTLWTRTYPFSRALFGAGISVRSVAENRYGQNFSCKPSGSSATNRFPGLLAPNESKPKCFAALAG